MSSFRVNAALRLCPQEVQIRSPLQLHQMKVRQETRGMHLQMASFLKQVIWKMTPVSAWLPRS